jgi:hypothetical protein
MPDQSRPDEALKDQAIEQAVAGDIIGARQIIGGMVERRYVSEVWRAILCIQTCRGDIQGVKETIVSCPDKSLLHSHQYRECPLDFARAGDVSGAIEIAKIMGSCGVLPLLMIPLVLANKGNFVGAREAVSHTEYEAHRSVVRNCVDGLQQKGKTPEESSQP